MSYIHPLWLEARRKYYMRHDSYRFFKPGSPEAKMPGWLDPSATRVRWKEAEEDAARAQAAAERERPEAEMRGMRTLVDHLKSYFALRRQAERSSHLWPHADRALERFNVAYARYFGEEKGGFNPSQPREPAGSSDGGQWTSGSDGGQEVGDGGGDASPSAGESLRQNQRSPQQTESLAQSRKAFLAPGPGQEPRRDLLELDAIARHPTIRARIDEAWTASDPNGFGREQGSGFHATMRPESYSRGLLPMRAVRQG